MNLFRKKPDLRLYEAAVDFVALNAVAIGRKVEDGVPVTKILHWENGRIATLWLTTISEERHKELVAQFTTAEQSGRLAKK